MAKRSILIFGVGELQLSIINRAKMMGLYTIGIDPCEEAMGKNDVDEFEVVGGQDFEGTLSVAKKHSVSALITAATDKPLVMMARIAKELSLPCFSIETAQWSTDKYLMKQRFIENDIPCANGKLIYHKNTLSDFSFPVIVKPRDNSGSRGVKLCQTLYELHDSINEALDYSRLDSVLVEEVIVGQEYSIESLHYDNKTEIIQITEKRTTPFPYNVELGHKQPAIISDTLRNEISEIIKKIGTALKFENCASHTELKVNKRGIFVIETSPRLGGDYITSTLTPLSTGINIEDQLLHVALGDNVDIMTGRVEKASGVCFFCLPEGRIKAINPAIATIKTWPGVHSFILRRHEGDTVEKITSSLNRYGQIIISGNNRKEVDCWLDEYEKKIESYILMA